MEDDQQQFLHETQTEAHYWWTVAEFAELSLNVPLDKMLLDMVQYRNKLLEKEGNR